MAKKRSKKAAAAFSRCWDCWRTCRRSVSHRWHTKACAGVRKHYTCHLAVVALLIILCARAVCSWSLREAITAGSSHIIEKGFSSLRCRTFARSKFFRTIMIKRKSGYVAEKHAFLEGVIRCSGCVTSDVIQRACALPHEIFKGIHFCRHSEDTPILHKAKSTRAHDFEHDEAPYGLFKRLHWCFF